MDMLPEYAKPGDRLMVCHNCDYKWGYSGSKKRATCPSCSRKTKVAENQLGMVLLSDSEILLNIEEYDKEVQDVLSLGLRTGDRAFRQKLCETFPTKKGDSRGL